MTDRIARLKEQMLSAVPTICTERARFYTETYRVNEDKPVVLKRALALSRTLREMTIFINPGELIVGNHSSRNRGAPIFPEYAVEWVLKELDEFEVRPGDAFFPDQAVKAELRALCPYWLGKTTLDKGRSLMSGELREIHEAGIIRAEGNLTSGDAHIAVNNRRLLALGIQGYRDMVEERRAALEPWNYGDLQKEQFYQGVLLSLDALSAFILRYADLASSMAAAEADGARAVELSEIAAVCAALSRRPPESFREALQLTWFVQLVLQIESNGHSMSLGRLDQYLYPFYAADLAAGRSGEAAAMELLENLWIKLYSILKIRSWSHTRYSAGSPLYQNVTIGGRTAEGADAVNPLSFLVLRSVGETRLTQPNLSVRFHAGLGEEFLMECLGVIERGFGMPAFNNDEVVIPMLERLGVEREDAYDYSAIGCIEIAVPGKWGYRCTGKHFLNFMRVFLMALRNGKDTRSGKTFHPGIGRLEDFSTFDQVMAAWQDQLKFYTRAGVSIDAAIDTVLEAEAPDLLCSAFTDDCIGRGKTIHQGGSKYDIVSGLQVGIANLGNSLAAIRKLVFREGRISADRLMAALDSDFQGGEGEKVRQLLLNEAPKFGNDDDEVDLLLRDAYLMYCDEIEKYHTIRAGRGPLGCRFMAGTSSISANVPSGAAVPATPDGRMPNVPLAEGCSPTSGTDLLGPTAVFKSVAKLPTDRIFGGVLLNQKLHPAVIAEEENKRKLISLLRVFFGKLKGWHVQYNIVDRETLLAAKKDPASYRDLIVRVAGYSAFFTTLSPDTQDDIIARTEHSL